MVRSQWIRVALLSVLLLGWVARGGHPPQPVPMDPKNLTNEQKELLNYAYLTVRPDLLAAIKPTGDQRVVARYARMGVDYIVTLQRTPQGEAVIGGGRGGGGGMVKFVLQRLEHLRTALSDEQRQAFSKLVVDQKLEQVTVDAWSSYFLLRYTFGPDDRVEKVKTSDGRILDVVIPEKDDINQWWTELQIADEVMRALKHELWEIRTPAGDWLIRRGPGNLNDEQKKQVARMILEWVEKGEASAAGWWMQAYSRVAQPEDERRVLALLEKSDLHQLSGLVAAYAAVAPAKALDYIAKPRDDKQYRMRAIQGLGQAPDGLRLLQLARTTMPDMKWYIDQQVKSVTELQKARAEGRPEDPGEAAALEKRKKAQRDAEAREKSDKKPGDYQGYDDWFADLSSTDRARYRKASEHFVGSVHAVDLSTVTPAQRVAVFKIAHAAVIAPKTTIDRDHAGKLLIASASRDDTETLVALVQPDNGRSHYAIAALIRVNPDKAGQLMLDIVEGRLKFRISPLKQAASHVPADAIPVLEKVQARLKGKGEREYLGQIIAETQKVRDAREG